MAVELHELRAIVGADLSGLKKQLKEGEDGFVSLESIAVNTFDDMGKAAKILGVGIGIVGTALTAAAVATKRFLDAYEGQRVAVAQVEAALESTGHAAGVTTKQITEFASARQAITNFGDEVTIQAASVLLSFTRIREDAFLRTLEAAQDMSARIGGDLQGAVMQLGKALDSPTIGLTMLRRAGVTFTQDQIDLIKSLEESGHLLEAQGMILDAVEKKFGGAAAAMANPWTMLKNVLSDIEESIGEVLFPITSEFGDLLKEIALIMSSALVPAFKQVVERFREMTAESKDRLLASLEELAQSMADLVITMVESGLIDAMVNFVALLGKIGGAQLGDTLRNLNAVLDVLNQILKNPMTGALLGVAATGAGGGRTGRVRTQGDFQAGGEFKSPTTAAAGTALEAAVDGADGAAASAEDKLQQQLDQIYIDAAQKENERLEEKAAEDQRLMDMLHQQYLDAAAAENERIEAEYEAWKARQAEIEAEKADAAEQAVPVIDSIVSAFQSLPAEQANELENRLTEIRNQFSAGSITAQEYTASLDQLQKASEQAVAAAEKETAQKRMQALLKGDFAGAGLNFKDAVRQQFQQQAAAFRQGQFDNAVQGFVQQLLAMNGFVEQTGQVFQQLGPQMNQFGEDLRGAGEFMAGFKPAGAEDAQKVQEAFQTLGSLFSQREGQIALIKNNLALAEQNLRFAGSAARRQEIMDEIARLTAALNNLLTTPPPIIAGWSGDGIVGDPGLQSGDDDDGGGGRGRRRGSATVNIQSVFPPSPADKRMIADSIIEELFRRGFRV